MERCIVEKSARERAREKRRARKGARERAPEKVGAERMWRAVRFRPDFPTLFLARSFQRAVSRALFLARCFSRALWHFALSGTSRPLALRALWHFPPLASDECQSSKPPRSHRGCWAACVRDRRPPPAPPRTPCFPARSAASYWESSSSPSASPHWLVASA